MAIRLGLYWRKKLENENVMKQQIAIGPEGGWLMETIEYCMYCLPSPPLISSRNNTSGDWEGAWGRG